MHQRNDFSLVHNRGGQESGMLKVSQLDSLITLSFF